jgi:hydroxylaminobenzene mutase
MNGDNKPRRLMWHGIFLFLLGLLTGVAIPALTNPRMGVSAHLEGVLNGIFLIVLGLIWRELRLTPKGATATFRIALYGTYANWAATFAAAILGTSRLTPQAGSGHSAAFWQEALVGFGQVSLALAMLICCLFVLSGLREVRK